MWRLTSDIPHHVGVAVSGGPDSMALLHFVSQIRKRRVEAMMFNHGTAMHERALPVVQELCNKFGVQLHVSEPASAVPKLVSPEAYWRDCRYAWLDAFNIPILTGHNLDDVIETWLFSSVNGTAKLIPNRRNNILRPLLAVSKQEILSYCASKEVQYVLDPANYDDRYRRTIVRHEMIPIALKVNPGLYSTFKKAILREYR